MKLLVITFLLSFYTFGSFAQNSPQTCIDIFFSEYVKKGPKTAVDNIYKTNPWFAKVPDAVINTRSEFMKFNTELVGNYHGNILIDKIETADCYAIYTYFMKFDRQPLRLTFEFYKPDKEWQLQSFKFDDTFDDDFEKALITKYTLK